MRVTTLYPPAKQIIMHLFKVVSTDVPKQAVWFISISATLSFIFFGSSLYPSLARYDHRNQLYESARSALLAR
jgi:hypothetical protein